ncbi:MAG: tRNA (guanosine(37)-N1)-methyltransferase TrmD [Puniceicoccales bacterium]|jgi:tRNA (guanine37-N1)-methyltransferase|nr:tRNA (guanosine(37)-N1)-methyltransferase TrmD [Puniceicoccales bacterium]
MLKFDCLSLFPEMLEGFVSCSIIGRAMQNGLVEIHSHNLRDWTTDRRHVADDSPFGGGSGMVMRPEPIFSAIGELQNTSSKVIFLCPDGEILTTQLAEDLSREEHLILLSGHYEGVDERVRDTLIDREISIGDYVLTNGTLPSAVLIDAIVRQIPGVLGDENSLTQDSFSGGLLSFPQYTRPAKFRGMSVPDVLLSGNHGKIAQWRQEQRLLRTKKRRPDLMKLRELE